MKVYTVTFGGDTDVTVSAAQDLFEITPADDRPVQILGFELGQRSDYGDAQDEGLRITIVRGHTTSGSGGSTPTPQPLVPSDPSASFTAEANNTTQASGGTTATLWTGVWNVRAGCTMFFPPDMRPMAHQGNTTIVLRQSAPADAITMSGTLFVAEL